MNANTWIQQQTDMSFEDALKIGTPGATEQYTISEFVLKATHGFHHDSVSQKMRLLQALAAKGIDVVDGCEEEIYRCVKNIDEDGDDLPTVMHARDSLKMRGQGALSKLGVSVGVLSSSYGGLSAFDKLLERYGLSKE